VTHFRADLIVQNVGDESDYLSGDGAVVLDSLGNQYNAEYEGTLELGQLHPNVKREGYLLFQPLKKESSEIKVLLEKSSYPEDIIYEFSVKLQ